MGHNGDTNTRTYNSQATKSRIFEAAALEFAQYGIAGARIDRIAAQAQANKPIVQMESSGLAWEPYAVERLADLRQSGKPVFVNFTASWCIIGSSIAHSPTTFESAPGVSVAASPKAAAVRPGAAAPDFTGTDSNGQTRRLSDFKGKVVVLEWTNHQCPFVGKHYGTNNMQQLQKEATSKGVVWLSIVSSAPGQQGYVTANQANDLTKSRNAVPTAVILDPEGEIGRLYNARTTPHMYVFGQNGTMMYMGAIDDAPSSQTADVQKANNYVRTALVDILPGVNARGFHRVTSNGS